MSVHNLITHFFLVPNNATLSGCTTVYLWRTTLQTKTVSQWQGILQGLGVCVLVSESGGNGGVGIAVIFFLPCLKSFYKHQLRERSWYRTEFIVKVLQKYFHNHKGKSSSLTFL